MKIIFPWIVTALLLCVSLLCGCTIQTYVDKSVVLYLPNNSGVITTHVENTSETTPTTSTSTDAGLNLPIP